MLKSTLSSFVVVCRPVCWCCFVFVTSLRDIVYTAINNNNNNNKVLSPHLKDLPLIIYIALTLLVAPSSLLRATAKLTLTLT